MKSKKIVLLLASLLLIGCDNTNKVEPDPNNGTNNNVTKCTNHTWGEKVILEQATCTKDGKTQRTCTVCGEKEEPEIIPASHNFVDFEERGNVCEGKYKIQKCTVCGETRETARVGYGGHENATYYEEVLPSYFYDGYVAHYKCSTCGNLLTTDHKITTEDAIKLEKAGDDIGLSVNGVQKGTFTLLEKNPSEVSWKIENIELKVNDVLSINKPGDVSYKYSFFNGNKITQDKKSELEGTFTLNLFATPNGFNLSIVEPVQRALVVKVNSQDRYPLTQVTYYESEKETYIYGYHYFSVGDVMVIDDEVNGQIYNYLDLEKDTKWNLYDFHKGDNNEIVFDVAGKYGIEFSRGGDKKISITKSFAPASEGDFDLEIFSKTTPVPFMQETIATDSEDYKSLAWYANHEAVTNNEDNKAAIANGMSLYMASYEFAADETFRIANVTDPSKTTYMGADHLVSVMADEGAVTIYCGYFKINKAGSYVVLYAPAYDSIYITATRAPVLSTVYAVVDGKQMNLTSDANTCVHINNQHMDANKTIACFKINNGSAEYINLTLDSSIDSSIATTMTTQGITFVVFKKAGTYNITIDLSTSVVTMTYELDPEPQGIDPTHNLKVTLNITRGSDRITETMTVNQTTGKAIASHLNLKVGDMILSASVQDLTIYEFYSINTFADGYDTSILNVQTFDTTNMNLIIKESTYQITLDLATQLLSIQETIE